MAVFVIDKTNSGDDYLYVDVPTHGLTVMIGNGDDGVTVDMYPMAEVWDEPIAAIWATTTEGANHK